jgi:hypothetical protein
MTESSLPGGTLRAAGVVFFVALFARGTFLAAEGVKYNHDSYALQTIARNVATRGAYSVSEGPLFPPTIRRAPLYPAFLALLGATDQATATRAAVAQIALDALTAALLVLFAGTVVPLPWAVAVGIAYALHPGEIDATRRVLSETLFTTVLMGSVVAVAFGTLRGRVALTAAGGFALGVAILTRPIAMPFLAIIPLTVALAGRPARFARHVAAFVGAAALVVAPWSLRSSLVAQSLVLVQGHSTVNLYVPTRYDWSQENQELLWSRLVTEDEWGRMMAAVSTPREDVEVDRIGLRYAIANVRADPAAYLASRVKAYPHLLVSSFDKFTQIHASFGSLLADGRVGLLAVKAGLLVVFSILPLAAAVLGLRASLRSRSGALAASVWVFTALVHVPLWIEYRFWLPAVPFVLVSGAVGVRSLREWSRRS